MAFAVFPVAYAAKAGADAAAHASFHGNFAGNAGFFCHLGGGPHHDAGSADAGFVHFFFSEEFGQHGHGEAFDAVGAVVGGDDHLSYFLGEEVFPEDFFLISAADDYGHLAFPGGAGHEEDGGDAYAAADAYDMVPVHIKGGAQGSQAVQGVPHFQMGHGFCPFSYNAVDDFHDAPACIGAGDGNGTAQDTAGIVHFHMDELARFRFFGDAGQFDLHEPDIRTHMVMDPDDSFFYKT